MEIIERDEEAIESLPVIDAELIEDGKEKSVTKNAKSSAPSKPTVARQEVSNNQPSVVRYILVPLFLLTSTLLGGFRLAENTNAFLFLRPALFCLIFAAILLVLFFRARLIQIDGWFSEDFTILKNTANAAVLLTLFSASVQIFNSLLPEQGLPLWIIGFCFFWTLWNNLFAAFDVKRLIQSLGGLFGLAFIVKYLILANLAAPTTGSWWQSITQNPGQTAFTWLLDLPKFSAATGYVQFFTIAFYLIGLFLIKPSTKEKETLEGKVS